jgi:16S rRNA (uracil1498-N3)-methyltransferase
MAVKSVYLPVLPSDDVIHIGGGEHHHLMVARAAENESIEILDGRGNVLSAVVVAVGRREISARVASRRFVERDPYELILGQALIRTAAFEMVLEKAVEIGVTRIIPFAASRSNMPPAKRGERWNRIVIEAAKQSKRYWFPIVEAPTSFEAILSSPVSSRILFAERGGGPLKPAMNGAPVLYLIGPEGGWTDAEMDAARRSGFELVSLGAGILKAETAAIVAGALIRYELG